ncbi:hypothetical protein M2092_001718 [Fusobacterium sp. PH5-44]
MKFNIDEIKFNKKEANQLKNIETKEEKQLEKELEGE